MIYDTYSILIHDVIVMMHTYHENNLLSPSRSVHCGLHVRLDPLDLTSPDYLKEFPVDLYILFRKNFACRFCDSLEVLSCQRQDRRASP